MILKNVVLLLCTSQVLCQWNGEELAMYDLVEDLNQNFYEFFGVQKDASTADIKRAYRKMSLDYHPDRNSADDAADQFRRVVSVYEILKSAELREKYDNVLEFGLPDWRQPIYYYRKMRKLSWVEAVLVLLGISTITHYLMMWAAFYEKKLVFSQNMKKSKKKKSQESDDSNNNAIEQALMEYRPKLINLLPMHIGRGCIWMSKAIFYEIQDYLATRVGEQVEEQTDDEITERKRAAVTPRPEYVFEMAKDVKAVSTNDPGMEEVFDKEREEIALKKAGAGWNMEELSLLIRLNTEKYPPGTPGRWELIGRALNRTAQDVTVMAGKVKNMKQEEYSKLIKGQQSSSINAAPSPDVKLDNTINTVFVSDWSQEEQRLLEVALQKHPKGTNERWERISADVATKSKEECMARFKHLVEVLRKRKTVSS